MKQKCGLCQQLGHKRQTCPTTRGGDTRKVCSSCREPKEHSEFPVRSKKTGELQRLCKPCFRPYRRKWYERHRKEQIKRSNKNRQDRFGVRRELLRELKAKPCADCGLSFHWSAMDFDHREDKREAVSQMVAHGYTVDEILAEVAKCDVVCSNCHRFRTWKRKEMGVEISKSTIPPKYARTSPRRV